VKSDQAGSAVALAFLSLKAHPGQSLLSMLGTAVGAACVVLVVSVGLTGKQYVLKTIEGIGTNIIALDYAYGGPGEPGADTSKDDYLTFADEGAIDDQVKEVTASSPMLTLHQNFILGHGQVSDVQVLGVTPEYRAVRSLIITAGRFFDRADSTLSEKAAVVTPQLAKELFGSPTEAVGHNIDIEGLPFTIIGTCKERVDTFGQSELSEHTILIPYSVARTMVLTDDVNQIFFSTRDQSEIDAAAASISRIVKSRHRPSSDYRVTTLTGMLKAAGEIANALTLVLICVTVVTLAVGGVGIMNIMMATVASRVYEIGLRKSLGATERVILLQFLAEAVVISLLGGLVGTSLALAVPLSLRIFTPYAVRVSYWSAIIALAAACGVGLVFGTMPALRAARLSPLDALRREG
jgi:putative ABC transport system permease protein